LQVLNNPKHPEHTEYLEWIGDTFAPDAFDLDEINRLLHAMR
jgi:hypothetical protein